MKNKYSWFAAPAALALSMGAHAGVIDLFEDFQADADPTNGGSGHWSFVDETVAGRILGTERDVNVNAVSGAEDNIPIGGPPNDICDVGDACSRVTITGGVLSFSNDAPAVVGELIVQWDGDDNSSALAEEGLAGIDLRDDGAEAIKFEVLTADLGFNFILEVYTDANNFTKVEIESSGAPQTRTILFTALENAALCTAPPASLPAGIVSVTCGGGGGNQPVDMSDLGAIQLLVNTTTGTAAVDLSIGPVRTTVPEPGVLGLMGIGLLFAGFAASRRRRA